MVVFKIIKVALTTFKLGARKRHFVHLLTGYTILYNIYAKIKRKIFRGITYRYIQVYINESVNTSLGVY